MPDPIFESFQQPVEVSPGDPRDIRRRGDRRRRRTAIATVAGAAAVIAAVVAPVAALSGGDEKPAPPLYTPSPTATPSGAWRLTVPGDLPLGDGVAMPGEATAPVHPGEGTTLSVCGTDVWSADRPEAWTDVATATNADDVEAADGTDSRTLALYPDGAAAKRVLAGVAQALDACSSDPSGHGPGTAERVGDGYAWVLRRPEATGSGPSSALVTAARVGNALLVQRDDLRSGGDLTMDEAVAFYREGQAGVVAAMCVFAADPCASADPPGTPQSTDDSVAHVDEIPSAFPIDAAHVDPGSDGEVGTPSQDGDGVVLDPCGANAWTVPAQDRLTFLVTFPEGADSRELRTYPSADDAVRQMGRLRTAVADCPRHDSSDPGSAASWITHSVDTGYDSFAVATTYDQGLGGGAWLFTRVGRSILAVAEGGEFSRETVWGALPTLLDRTNGITPSMCLFTEAGC